ncbi:hypothetical protein QTN25_002876 [Entamoeba marina]
MLISISCGESGYNVKNTGLNDNVNPIQVFNNYFPLVNDALITLNFLQDQNTNSSIFKTKTNNILTFLLSTHALVNDTKLYKLIVLHISERLVYLAKLEVFRLYSKIHLHDYICGTLNLPRIAPKIVVSTLVEEMACQYDGELYLQHKRTLAISSHDKVRFVEKNSFSK